MGTTYQYPLDGEPFRPSRDQFMEAQRRTELASRAPKFLDALRLIRFAMITDHEDSRMRAEKVLKLAEAALQGTEDL